MAMDMIRGRWMQLRGDVKQRWGQLTDDDIDKIEGRFDKLVGTLVEKYGYTRERAEEEARLFFKDKGLEERAA